LFFKKIRTEMSRHHSLLADTELVYELVFNNLKTGLCPGSEVQKTWFPSN